MLLLLSIVINGQHRSEDNAIILKTNISYIVMRKLILFLTLLTGVGPAMADNIIVEDVVVQPGGSINVPIRYHFETKDLYGGYQFEIVLPNGITTELNGDGDPAFVNGDGLDGNFYSFSSQDPDTGNGLFCGFSEGGTILNTEGTLGRISLAADKALESGTTLTGKIIKVAFGNIDGKNTFFSDDVEFNITIDKPGIDTDISQLENAIYIEPMESLVGKKIDLRVKMKNMLTPVGCSSKLTLPEGLRLQKDEDGDVEYTLGDRAKEMAVTMQDWNNGSYDFALTPSTAEASITGNDDVFITFKVQIPDDMVAGDYKLKLMKCILQSKVNGTTTDIILSDVVTTLTLNDYILGDVNNDGRVSISDVSVLRNYLLGKNPAKYHGEAADMNGDGRVSISDVSKLVNLLLNKH